MPCRLATPQSGAFCRIRTHDPLGVNEMRSPAALRKQMVGDVGFEPTISRPQSVRLEPNSANPQENNMVGTLGIEPSQLSATVLQTAPCP
jgi:hypothetical protein